ncbi:hypothetical protein M406DRAFT_327392 [Cryphonectria parasitica EP155]|uniref:Uncharacterized protein n=1 Tax=Cryphonectria parasitica (strain ATCC 38755 / EP155) TaxID=660469 RepID=A0A9P4Y8M4_CRYP1|nr:uncharacterized protein M406DRAFT_327392 [Cryphonectria parasitica EP155]KAF3768984.1 hypothetical protein M406DRAFT_327392 [Cryphonectria parasitica EP155]
MQPSCALLLGLVASCSPPWTDTRMPQPPGTAKEKRDDEDNDSTMHYARHASCKYERLIPPLKESAQISHHLQQQPQNCRRLSKDKFLGKPELRCDVLKLLRDIEPHGVAGP